MSVRERAGLLAGEKVFLSRHVDEPYTRRYVDVASERIDIPGDPGSILVDPEVRRWHVDDWSAGEGEDRWLNDGTYNTSDGVRPKAQGRGLIQGPARGRSQDNTGIADFQDGRILGYGRGSVWTLIDGDAYKWLAATEKWSAAVTTGAVGSDATSLGEVDSPGGADWIYSGHEDLKIYRWKSASNETHYDTGTGDDFTYAPVVIPWGASLYALDGDDLYSIDRTTADTRTKVADVGGRSDEYLADTACYNRASTSDVGPIWMQRLDNGQTFIHQYNVASDTHSIIGRLANDFVFPYDIHFANGFIFVAYRYAPESTMDGEAWIYFQRGAQKGQLGPIRATGAEGTPILLAGAIDNELIFHYSKALWSYSFSTGAIVYLAEQFSTGQAFAAITFGRRVFVSDISASHYVDTWDFEEYNTGQSSQTLETGRYHMGFPGVDKVLLDLVVVTDPLPANTTVTLSYSADGGSWAAMGDVHDVDGAQQFVWEFSDSASAVTGTEFEFSIGLTTSTSTSTATVRSITARAMANERNVEWFLNLDLTNAIGEGDDPSQSELVRRLEAIRDADALVDFEDPWLSDLHDDPESFLVRVKEIRFPDASVEGQQTVFVRLREVPENTEEGV